jgi:hypothetical protein
MPRFVELVNKTCVGVTGTVSKTKEPTESMTIQLDEYALEM